MELRVFHNFSLGSGPYSFTAWVPSVKKRISNQIAPIIGIRATSNIHPLFPMSCNLLTDTARLGINIANEYSKLIGPLPYPPNAIPKILSRAIATKPKIKLKRTNDQNSVLLALPPNSAYLFFKMSRYQFMIIIY